MLRKEEILSRTSNGLNVFKHYIKTPWRVGRNFLNPLYEDKKASCNIYFDRNSGTYRMKDFGNDDFSGDCFFFVAKLHALDCRNRYDFIEILKIIDRDLSLGLSENNGIAGNKDNLMTTTTKASTFYETAEKKIRPYSFQSKEFSAEELAFWQKFGVRVDILSLFNVCSVRDFASENGDGKPYTLYSTKMEPIFGYKSKRYIKLYRPFSKIRFLYGGSIVDNYCFGLEQLPSKGDKVFITGGEKDVLSLSARGLHAICFNSETATIPKSIIRKLSFRFKHIILLYDMDKTGLSSSAKHEKDLKDLGVKRLLLPLSGTKDEKDISDYFSMGNTYESFMKLFLEFLDTLYSDTMTLLKSCEIDFNNPPESSQQIISAGDVPLGTQGNILCITGGEGTGKSNFIAALIAGSIRKEKAEIDTLGMTVSTNNQNKAVLLYDTEQSEVQLFKNVFNLLKRAKLNYKPEVLKAFSLTGMSRNERLLAIVQSMDRFHYQYSGIQLVMIDGIADLVHSANDEAESIRIIDELYRLAGIYKTCIVCVLHYIPNGLKLRGHLGSELQRKAAAILSIELDNDPSISVVKALKVREGSPLDVPLMQFSWDKEAGMHLYLGEKPRQEKEKRKEKELEIVAKSIFSTQSHLTYMDISEKIQEIMDVKERTSKSYIRYMREKEIIVKDPSNDTYFIKGKI
jgi:archaellum biogenesis ATPase FlaH